MSVDRPLEWSIVVTESTSGAIGPLAVVGDAHPLPFLRGVKKDVPEYLGVIYLGSEEVWAYHEPTDRTPAGEEDFAGVVAKKFARRLSELLEDTRKR